MAEKLLEVKDLYVEYNTDEGDVYAVNGMSLSLNKGQVLGLVGETGAGKSTLALSILKLLPDKVGNIKSGEIYYDGIDVVNADDKQMFHLRGDRISMIFQDPMTSLNPILTVGQQIDEVLELHYPEMSKEERSKKVDNIMQLVGILPSRKSEYPHQFSGGMKQRIGIAMALVAEPELLIADEPTTALDVTIQAQILHLMANLKEQMNSSMILITHDLGVVASFCETVAVVYAGAIIEEGTILEVFTRDANHPYTEGLFNSIPDLTSKADRLVPIPGYMVDPMNLPAGCKFAERCQYATEKCFKQEPPMYDLGGTHRVKCFKYEQKEVK